MKQVLFLFVSLFVLSCSKNPVPKPDNLLDEEVMVNIIYDISILQATDGSMSYKLSDHNIKMDQYIFEKYKIDSITYRENQRYYAADARKYKKIYKKVIERFEKENPANTQNINNETSVGGYNNSVE
ncbi:DUF4296 domain-containing protein [Flavobacterium cheniae]|jgi:hypothetical protein|uniref:Uncharacterized protein DUF4296 n=1 Tax=Flavobacterium cheniae TaxID=295428 RepID=A0A562KM47_9FLAO|nr:DUF4296 domain-containing protein [Flavobacterium cheniae]TDR24298.1 uncharacterized protein DUF4296 [Flavobacterium cheniae]TWH96417.1 uncharacterized protein DUF4296 [Flavobacterium cheniae]